MHDAFFQRVYPVVVLAGLAVTARFQASGVTTLLADGYLDVPVPRSRAPRHHQRGAGTTRSARPILVRNAFDSETGSLNAATGAAEREVSPSPRASPLMAPECGDIFAHAVTESADPTWSATVLVTAADIPGVTRRIGDQLGRRRVTFIGYNEMRNSPSVWLESGSALCQVLLFGSTRQAIPSPGTAKQPRGSELPRTIADRIERLSATEYRIDRTAVDEVLGNQMTLLQAIRVVPEQQEGKVVGLRLVGVLPGSLLASLGLKSGDLLESINGFDVTDPGSALEAYARIRGADKLTVRITRAGRPASIVVAIR